MNLLDMHHINCLGSVGKSLSHAISQPIRGTEDQKPLYLYLSNLDYTAFI